MQKSLPSRRKSPMPPRPDYSIAERCWNFVDARLRRRPCGLAATYLRWSRQERLTIGYPCKRQMRLQRHEWFSAKRAIAAPGYAGTSRRSVSARLGPSTRRGIHQRTADRCGAHPSARSRQWCGPRHLLVDRNGERNTGGRRRRPQEHRARCADGSFNARRSRLFEQAVHRCRSLFAASTGFDLARCSACGVSALLPPCRGSHAAADSDDDQRHLGRHGGLRGAGRWPPGWHDAGRAPQRHGACFQARRTFQLQQLRL